MNTTAQPVKPDQQAIGIYEKYTVTRTDGTDQPGGKHHGDKYFVLELTDKHAMPAISAYANSCQDEYPALAKDLRGIVNEHYQDKDEFVRVPETTLPNGTVVPRFLLGKYACSQSGIGTAIVTADRKPWRNINFHKAKQACSDAGYALITELQYLAIAYQITQQDANWTGGKVGDGEVYRGLHKGTVSEPQDGHYESSEPTERRWHVLANGERVFDISGNIYSWVFDDVQGNDNGIVAKKFAKDSPTATTAPYKSREHGIGDTSIGGGDWSGNALLRGGRWGSDDNAGVFSLNYDWPGSDGDIVGFRCTKRL